MDGMPDLIEQLTARGPGGPVFHRYVALGDSFTEGVGDHDPRLPNGVRGWADRVAEVLATHADDFRYANLAIRGRKMAAILAEQVEPALALHPDLVSVYAGGNDILRPRVSTAWGGRSGWSTPCGMPSTSRTWMAMNWWPAGPRCRRSWSQYLQSRSTRNRQKSTIVAPWRSADQRTSSL